MARAALAVLTAIAVVASAAPSSAAPITVSFSATVVQFVDDSGVTDGSIAPGSIMTGTLTLDPAAAPVSSDASGVGTIAYYDFASPPWLSTAQVGNYSFTSLGHVIEVAVADRHSGNIEDGGDVFQAISLTTAPGPLAGTFIQAGFGLVLVDTTQALLSSTSLASVPFDLSEWDVPGVNLTMLTSAGEVDSLIRVDSLSVAAPEPAGLVLVPLLLATLRRRPRAG